MTDHSTSVKLDGDSGTLVSAYAKATGASNEFTTGVGKSGKALDVWDQTAKRAADSTNKLSKVNVQASAVATGLAKAVSVAKGGTLDLANAALQGVSAFGPWGAAISLAGGALLGYIANSNAATDATAKLRIERMKADAAAVDARNAETVAWFKRKEELSEQTKAEQERYFQNVKIAETAEELIGLEDALAQHGRGKDTLALQREENRIRVENLKIQGDTAGAAKLERDFQLHTSEILTQQNKTRKANAKVTDDAFASALADMKRAGALQREGSDTRDEHAAFQSELGRVGAMQRGGSDTRDAGAAEAKSAAAMREIDVQRATTGETIALIEQEKQARLDLVQVEIDAATTGAERMELRQQQEEIAHEATIKRISLQRDAEDKLIARKAQIMDITGTLLARGMSLANLAAQTAGVSAKKQAAIASGLGGSIAAVTGTIEAVKAAASFAGQNYIEGAEHVAASVFAFAESALLYAQAGGAGQGGGGGGGGGPSGGGVASTGSTSTPRGGTFPGSDSSVPGSPGPQTSTAAGQSSGSHRTTVMHVQEVHLYGLPHREWVSNLQEALAVDRQGSRERRT